MQNIVILSIFTIMVEYIHVFWKGQHEVPALGRYLWYTAWHLPLSTGWGPGHSASGCPGNYLSLKVQSMKTVNSLGISSVYYVTYIFRN